MPRPGASVMLVNSGLVVLTAVRVRVTIFWPPISVTAWARAAGTMNPASNAGMTIAGNASARTESLISTILFFSRFDP